MQTKLQIIETLEYYLAVSDKQPVENYYYDTNINNVRHTGGAEYAIDTSVMQIVGHQPKGNAPELDLPLLPELVVEDDVEKLALQDFKDNDDGFVSYKDRTEGFISGYEAATKVYSEDDVKSIIKWLNGNYSRVEDELAKPIEDAQLDLPDTFFIDAYEEALTRAINSIKQPTPKWFVASDNDLLGKAENSSIGNVRRENGLMVTTINGKTYLVGTYLYD
jgi:hypothetical protein